MRDIFGNEHVTDKMCLNVLKSIFDVLQAIIFGTRIYVQILVLQGFVKLSDVVKSGGIYSVRNAFATRLQQKYLKNIGHFSVIDTVERKLLYVLCSRAKKNLYLFSEYGRTTKNGLEYSSTDELSLIADMM